MASGSDRTQQPVFVVGAARSGTTLLQSLIASMPDFHSCPETHFFDELMSRGPVCGGYQLHRPRLENLPSNISEECLRKSFQKAEAGFLKIPLSVKKELLKRSQANSLTPSEYLYFLMGACYPGPRENQNIRWVEKTPIHISYLKQIFTLFPEALVVCVRRTPLDVLLSAVSTFRIPSCIAALDYYRSYRDVKKFLKLHSSYDNRIYFVSYESILCSDKALEGLLKFLEVEKLQLDLLKTAAKKRFFELYGDTVMLAIQPKMSGSLQKKLGMWQSKAIAGYASVLDSLFADSSASKKHLFFSTFPYLVPMVKDFFCGIIYILRWRIQWLLMLIVRLPFFHPESF